MGPCPMHEVVVMAVRAAVNAAMTMRMVTSQNLLPIFIAHYILGLPKPLPRRGC